MEDLEGANGGSERRGTRGLGLLLTPFGILLMRPVMDGTKRGRFLQMRSLVSSGQVAKAPLSIAVQKVDLAG